MGKAPQMEVRPYLPRRLSESRRTRQPKQLKERRLFRRRQRHRRRQVLLPPRCRHPKSRPKFRPKSRWPRQRSLRGHRESPASLTALYVQTGRQGRRWLARGSRAKPTRLSTAGCVRRRRRRSAALQRAHQRNSLTKHARPSPYSSIPSSFWMAPWPCLSHPTAHIRTAHIRLPVDAISLQAQHGAMTLRTPQMMARSSPPYSSKTAVRSRRMGRFSSPRMG